MAEQSEADNEWNGRDSASETSPVQRLWKPVSREGVEKLTQFQDQILQEHGGKPFESSVELIREQREERMRELMGENYEDEGQSLHPLTPEIYAKMMDVRQQILQNTNERIFEDSTELIRQMRMERSDELDQR